MAVRARFRGASLLTAALCFACGGNVGGEASAGSGGAASAPRQGCNSDAGSGGDSELSDYAALRTACDLGINVNRRGAPATIHFNVK
jgi:hypothetical protein